IDMARHCIQQGGLARAGATRDQDIDSAASRNVEELRHLRRDVSLADHLFECNVLLGKLADRNSAAIQDQRWQYDIDTATIGETSIDHWTGFVDATTNPRGDALRNMHNMLGVAKPRRRLCELAVSFDIDVVWSVDQDVGYLVIPQQWFEWPKADHI